MNTVKRKGRGYIIQTEDAPPLNLLMEMINKGEVPQEGKINPIDKYTLLYYPV